MVAIGQIGGIRQKVVVFRQKCSYSGKNSCIRAKLFIRAKVVAFGKSGCIRAREVLSWQ